MPRRWWLLGILLLSASWVMAAPPAIHPPAVSDSPFGVDVLLGDEGLGNLEADLAAIHQAGIGWVRVLPDWSRLQPQQDKLDWTLTDRVVRAARAQNLSILFTLGFMPQWASQYAHAAEMDVWNKNMPHQLMDWRQYVQALVGRYGSDVAYWQVWERPSIHYFRGSDRDMRELLRVTTQASHQMQPDERIVSPEEGRIHLGSLNALYSYGAQMYFDVLGLYPYFDRPEQMLRPLATLQTDIVRKKGPLKELWVCGMGWNVQPVEGPLHDPVVAEDEQARYLVRGTVLALSHGVRRVFWHAFRDQASGSYQMQSRSGLLRGDGTGRPAWTACQTLVQKLQGKPFRRLASWGPHTFGCMFGSDDQSVLVGWSDRNAASISLSGSVSTWDLQGRQAAGLKLTESPAYVTGPTGDLEKLLAASPQPPQDPDPDFSQAKEVSVILGSAPVETGLHVSRYHQLDAKTVQVTDCGGASCWSTDIANGKAEILMDIDDTFLYFVDGRYDVDVDVEAYGNTTDRRMGFNVGYDSMDGYKFTNWQWVDPGDGWKTYTFHISDANFSDPFCDLRINALGSKADVCVRSVRVRRRPK